MTGTQFHAVVKTGGNTRVGPAVLSWAFCAFLPCSAVADPLSACLPPVETAKAKVVRSESGGVLILKDHRPVKLEGLIWPKGSLELRQLGGQEIALRAAAPKLDRYGRSRSQVLLPNGKWLQRELLLRGAARVQIAPDRPECARELYAAEVEARAAHVGLWALPQYAIRTPDALRWRDLGTFQIVEGTVLNVKVSGRAYLNFGRNWRTDFTVTVSPDDMKSFRHAGADPYAYAGKRIRVRGYIDRMNGFQIEVASPEQIEVIE